jgi:hypothetical protein
MGGLYSFDSPLPGMEQTSLGSNAQTTGGICHSHDCLTYGGRRESGAATPQSRAPGA